MEEAARLKTIDLRTLLDEDPERFERFSADGAGILVDYSKEHIDTPALSALLDLARAAEVEARRDAMFQGEKVNTTEDRAVLHMALRDGVDETVVVDGERVLPEVRAVRDRMLAFAETVRTGPCTDVVSIGIGGSDLGPAMAVRALTAFANGPRVHFVSNVDGAHLGDTLKSLNPSQTMVIVVSKTFTTLETMTNARAARRWLGERAATQMAAVSTNLNATAEFGIPEERVFGFRDWVGGRYSVWSSVGLALAIAVGPEAFRAFLSGAAELDNHFRKAPLAQNLPVLMALAGIWRRNAMGSASVAVIPYDQRLAEFPAFLQQLDMESNGKGVDLNGEALSRPAGPVVFGVPGTNAQHSFFQLLHQGLEIVPVDFLLAREPVSADAEQHRLLASNALAQAAALAFGDPDARDPHRKFPGNRPSTMIVYDRLDPQTLGRLIALYEHKVFVQGVIWGINSFDQFGVELGKVLAKDLAPRMDSGDCSGLDGSTAGLIRTLRG
jgi:glucose-6-phosphate isomerase